MVRTHIADNLSQHRAIITSSAAVQARMAVTYKMAPKTNAGRLYSDIVTGRSAATQVFRIFELAEIIIQDFGPMDLIRISKLNRVTRAVVAGSAKMQEKLFFEAIPDSEKAVQVLQGTDADNNDMGTMSDSTRLKVVWEITHAISPHVVNKLVLDYHPSSMSGGIVGLASDYIRKGYERYVEPISVPHTLLNKPLSPHASCRGMYLAQPPVHRISVTIYGRCTGCIHVSGCINFQRGHMVAIARFTLSNSTGLTFGEFIDRVRYEIHKGPGYHPDYSRAYFKFEDGIPVKDAATKALVEELGLVTMYRRLC
ncbi:hypothetical protein LTR97_012186 [Elasticomyces elasticus]|uniref:Uncharacterized protein n=1 Tax=Elasticomyces elasticus TaxID=574655 RepID=A0AAN7VY20_9PEZI|nr:hypothetical protein LTR97_012186 [Elasticomyces elasticus]